MTSSTVIPFDITISVGFSTKCVKVHVYAVEVDVDNFTDALGT